MLNYSCFTSLVQPASVTATPACATRATASASAPLKASKEIAATCEFYLPHPVSFCPESVLSHVLSSPLRLQL